MNSLIGEKLFPLFQTMFLSSENNKESILKWVFALINYNLDRAKTVFHKLQVSSLGFILNILFILMKLYFSDIVKNMTESEEIEKIQLSYSNSNEDIKIAKYDKILKIEQNNNNNFEKKKDEEIEFNCISRLFFTIQTLIHLVLKNYHSEYEKLTREIDDLHYKEKIPYEDMRM